MTFSLIQRPGAADSAWHSISDGESHLIQLYQQQNDSNLAEEDRKHHQVLFWHGTIRSLNEAYTWHQRTIDAFRDMAPQYGYDHTTELECYFGNSVSVPGFASNMMGNVKLEVHGLGTRAKREIVAFLKRREKDWNNIHVVSMETIGLCVCGGDPCEIEFFMDTNLEPERLPIAVLADFIESTSPQALWYDPSKVKTNERGEEYRDEDSFKPWPLSHDELIDALKLIESQWFMTSDSKNVS